MAETENDTLLICTYGQYGVGKTVDALYAAPNSIIVGETMAVKTVAKSVCGFELDSKRIIIPTKGLNSIFEAAEYAIGKTQTLLVDDFSLIAQQEFVLLEGKGFKGFDLFRVFLARMFEFRVLVRRVKVHVFMSAHDGPPHLNSVTHRMTKGGPKCQGQAQEDIGATFDCMYHVITNPQRPVGFFAEYHVADDEQYVTKDRLNVVCGAVPANLSEVMRSGGYAVSRLKGMEWLDEAIPAYAKALAGAGNLTDRNVVGSAMKQLRENLITKYKITNPKHQNWCLRDAYDRVVIDTLVKQRQVGLFGG
jgi:hypothetical protein